MMNMLSSESGFYALVSDSRTSFFPPALGKIVTGPKKSRWVNTGRYLILCPNVHGPKRFEQGMMGGE